MANLDNALQQLRAEHKRAQFDQTISVIESLNGSGESRKSARQTRIVSPASRRKMSAAQKARWALAQALAVSHRRKCVCRRSPKTFVRRSEAQDRNCAAGKVGIVSDHSLSSPGHCR